MARNVIMQRRWIGATYKATFERDVLQSWVDRQPLQASIEQIADGLAAVLAAWPIERLAKISSHFTGEAFDVRPESGARAGRITSFIRALPGLDKFLEREGGLVRWHAQFH
jgi:hypothetical protein